MKKKRVYIFLAIASIAILAVIRNVQLKRAKAPEYVLRMLRINLRITRQQKEH